MNWPTAWLIAAQAAATGAAALLSRQPAWRRHFAVLGSVQVVLLLFSIGSLSALNFIQRLELLATGSGLLLWSAGMLGWRREGESRDLVVSWNLALGSLLSATPLVIGLLCHRLGLGWNELGWVMLHELGVLCIGLLLLGVGVLCRIRWSTLVGSTTLAVYVLSLVLLVRLPEQLQSTAVYMMVGGGTFFVLAVLLSIYRDRLLTLSRRAREGEGVFQVLTWR
jgi:hypothetical protein